MKTEFNGSLNIVSISFYSQNFKKDNLEYVDIYNLDKFHEHVARATFFFFSLCRCGCFVHRFLYQLHRPRKNMSKSQRKSTGVSVWDLQNVGFLNTGKWDLGYFQGEQCETPRLF